MATKVKKKLCWNCDGEVSWQQENCPYCAVYLNPNGEESANELFDPPYNLEEPEEESVPPPSPYTTTTVENVASASIPNDVQKPLEKNEDIKSAFLPLTLLLSGIVFLFFGMALMFFSRNGVLTLRWDGTYWFVYVFLGAALLTYGGYIVAKDER